jgi:hypothetical protein
LKTFVVSVPNFVKEVNAPRQTMLTRLRISQFVKPIHAKIDQFQPLFASFVAFWQLIERI